jgi:hypothetical protein
MARQPHRHTKAAGMKIATSQSHAVSGMILNRVGPAKPFACETVWTGRSWG